MKDRPNSARCLLLQDRTALPFAPLYAPKWESPAYYAARYEFFSPEVVVPPFLTLQRRRATDAAADVYIGGGSDTIAYATDYDWLDQLRQFPQRYQFARKWKNDVTRGVWSFLTQLTLQISAEARFQGVPLEQISWSFPLPASLAEQAAQTFQTIVRSVVGEYFSLQRVEPNVGFPLKSNAASNYMLRFSKMTSGVTRVVLNVGGHSTKAAVFLAGRQDPLWEGSIEIGGRDILIDDWVNNPNRWKAACELMSVYPSVVEQSSGRAVLESVSEPEFRQIVLEMVLNRDGILEDSWALTDAGEHAAALLTRLGWRASVVFFGLCFYMVQVLRMLNDREVDRRTIAGFNFCGRGSKLFRRCFSSGNTDSCGAGVQISPAMVTKFAQSCRDAISDCPPFGIPSFSPPEDASLEVALGATVISRAPDYDYTKGEHCLPLGDHLDVRFGENGVSRLGPVDVLEKRRIGQIQTITPVMNKQDEGDLPEFKAFLKAYFGTIGPDRVPLRYLSANGCSMSPELVAAAIQEFSVSLFDALDMESPTGYVQPLFICSLRALMRRWDSFAHPFP